MAVKRILRMGDMRLSRIAKPVTEFQTPKLNTLVQDLYDTVRAAKGAGIAAPQIGVDLRVVIIGVPTPRYPDSNSFSETVLINPSVQVIGQSVSKSWEGCLSVPTIRGLVERPDHIQYGWYDLNGQYFERKATGFHARVVQHEIDHLDGILFPQRVQDLRYLGFENEPGFKALVEKATDDGLS